MNLNEPQPACRSRRTPARGRLGRPIRGAGWCLLLAVVLMMTGCRTPVLSPIDVTQPGWRIEQGQGVWQSHRGKPELAGEVVLALGPESRSLIEFSKTPFPVVTAREEGDAWVIAFGSGARRYGGRGQPPSLFVWFQALRARAGRPTTGRWQVERPSDGSWVLRQPRSGERLQIWLAP